MSKDVLFYEPDDPNGYLSNFAECSIRIDDTVWQTSEHYYQAMKFTSQTLQQTILQAQSPEDAFLLSRQLESDVREDWYDIRIEVMRFIVQQKFQQNRPFALRLIQTGDSIIKEHSHKDSFWGDGGDGSGKNHLGLILMDVRQRLRTLEITQTEMTHTDL